MNKAELEIEYGSLVTIKRKDPNWDYYLDQAKDGSDAEEDAQEIQIESLEEAFMVIRRLTKFVEGKCLADIKQMELTVAAQKEWIQDGTLNPPEDSGPLGMAVYRDVSNGIDEQLRSGSWIQTLSNQLVEALDKLKRK